MQQNFQNIREMNDVDRNEIMNRMDFFLNKAFSELKMIGINACVIKLEIL